MTPEQFRRLDELYDAALGVSPAERTVYFLGFRRAAAVAAALDGKGLPAFDDATHGFKVAVDSAEPVPARFAEVTPWGTVRITGTGTPPYPLGDAELAVRR